MSILLMLLPMQGSMASIADSDSALGVTHHLSMQTNKADQESSHHTMHNVCEHCDSGKCNMTQDCFTGVCFTVTTTSLASTFYIDSKKSLAYPTETDHLVSAISPSLYRPPRH